MQLFAIIFFLIVIFCCIFGIGILISAFLRHREKQTRLTKTLLILQIYMNIFIIISLLSTLFLLFDIDVLDKPVTAGMFPSGISVLILGHTFFYHFTTLFLMIAFFYYYSFARLVFGEEEKGQKLVKFIISLIATSIVIEVVIDSILLYSIICLMLDIPINYELVSLSVYHLPLFGGFLFLATNSIVSIPICFNSLRVWKRIPEESPHKSNLLYLAVLAVLNIISIVFSVIDVLLVRTGAPSPTVAFVLTWICVPLIIYTAYRGFFSRRSGK